MGHPVSKLLSSLNRALVLETINPIGTAVFVLDVVGDGTFRVFAINRHTEKDIGMPVDSVAGKKLEEIMDPEHARWTGRFYQQCVETRSTVEFEDFFDAPEGRRYSRTTVVPIFSHDDRVVRLFGHGVEITAEKRAKEKLRESEARYRHVVEDQADFIVRWQPDGTRTFVNEASSDTLAGRREN